MKWAIPKDVQSAVKDQNKYRSSANVMSLFGAMKSGIPYDQAEKKKAHDAQGRRCRYNSR